MVSRLLFRPRKFDHVALGVQNLDKSFDWYKALLGFREYRPKDPMFHEKGLIKMICHSENEDIKIALLQFPADKPTHHDVPLTEKVVSRISDQQRTLHGHFAFAVDTKGEFDLLRAQLPVALALAGSGSPSIAATLGSDTSPASTPWIEYQNYGIQESLFFHDLDLNELEITYYSEE